MTTRPAWLSSGNWQSSNQPPADPLAEQPPDRQWLTRYNREWHIVIEHAGLARTLAAYLRHDYAHNLGADAGDRGRAAGVAGAAGGGAGRRGRREEAAAATWHYFPPYDAVRRFTVQPLLTPDNYHQHVLALVRARARSC